MPVARPVVAVFCVAMWLQLVPLLWPREPELFGPLGYTCVSQLVILASAIAYYVTRPMTDAMLPLQPAELADLFMRVGVAEVLATLAYFVGYHVTLDQSVRRPRWSRVKAPAVVQADAAPVRWSGVRVALVCVVCAAVFIPSYAYFQSQVHANITDATQLAAGKAVWREDPTLSWLHRGVAMGLVVPMLLLGYVLRDKRPSLWSLALVGALALALGFLSLRLGQRGTMIFFLATMVIIAHHLWRRIPFWAVLAMLFGGILLSNALGSIRRGEDQQTMSASATRDPIEVLANYEAERQHIAAIGVVLYTFPDRMDYLFGSSYIGLLVTPIPRWLWPEKNQYFLMRDTTIVWELTGAPLPSGFPATMYANFGWLGLIVGQIVWGRCHRRLYEWALANRANRNVLLLFAVMVVHVGPTLLQLADAIQSVLPMAVAVWFVTLRPAGARRVAPFKLPRLASAGPAPAPALPDAAAQVRAARAEPG
ncbi:MAG TPA: O-antigen polymerase [Byssovorax sp.]|jgi:hypothetical protein